MSKGEIKTELSDEFSPFGFAILTMVFLTVVRSFLVVVKPTWAAMCDKPVSICWLVLVCYLILSGFFSAVKEVVENNKKGGGKYGY